MEIILYTLIGIVTLLFIINIVLLFFILKTKKPVIDMSAINLDQSETLTQLNFVQEAVAKLRSEMEKAFIERFNAQTEKLSESDQTFLKAMREEIDKKLAALNKDVQEKLRLDAEKGEKTFTDLGKKMQEIVEANKEVINLGDDVKKLSTVISGGGARKGKFGEFLLESILEEVYEGTTNLYDMQYTLKGGARPDAVIILPRDKAGLLCIDAKFTYDNYARMFDENHNIISMEARKAFKNDVKGRIDEVRNKYIVKGETIDYAMCFFPSDEIYQFINTEADFVKDIVSYARKHNVVLVSPATLQPTLHTLKSLMIEYRRSQKLDEVNKMIIALAKEFKFLDERYAKFMKTLGTLLNDKAKLDITVGKLSRKFSLIKDDSEVEEEDESYEED